MTVHRNTRPLQDLLRAIGRASWREPLTDVERTSINAAADAIDRLVSAGALGAPEIAIVGGWRADPALTYLTDVEVELERVLAVLSDLEVGLTDLRATLAAAAEAHAAEQAKAAS